MHMAHIQRRLETWEDDCKRDADSLLALQQDIAFMFRATLKWYPTANREAPGIGTATHETLHIQTGRSIMGFSITKWASRTTVDVVVFVEGQPLPFNRTTASIEAWLNSSFVTFTADKCDGIRVAARALYFREDPDFALRHPEQSDEYQKYLALRYRHLAVDQEISAQMYLSSVLNSGYHGIKHVARLPDCPFSPEVYL
jgi:hypothetical protein